jgi:hypothetical protein
VAAARHGGAEWKHRLSNSGASTDNNRTGTHACRVVAINLHHA